MVTAAHSIRCRRERPRDDCVAFRNCTISWSASKHDAAYVSRTLASARQSVSLHRCAFAIQNACMAGECSSIDDVSRRIKCASRFVHAASGNCFSSCFAFDRASYLTLQWHRQQRANTTGFKLQPTHWRTARTRSEASPLSVHACTLLSWCACVKGDVQ